MRTMTTLTLTLVAVAGIFFMTAGTARAEICEHLHVDNETSGHLEIFYNNRHLGCIGEFECKDFCVEACGTQRQFVLSAYHVSSCGHVTLVKRLYGSRSYANFDWTIRGCRHH